MSISDRLDEMEDDIHDAFRLPKAAPVALVVEEDAVDRAVEWAVHAYNTTTKKERNAGLVNRPRLTRVEKVEALRRAERFIPRTVAARLLSAQPGGR